MSHLDTINQLQRGKPLSNPDPLKGEGPVNKALAFATKMLYKPAGWTGPHKIAYPSGLPPKSVCVKVAEAAYDSSPPKFIREWELIDHTATLKFYKSGDKILVGVRGTASRGDVYADLHIIANGLNRSPRFHSDLKKLKEVKAEYPDITFYGASHSLGGSLCDLFIKNGLLQSAVSYNPAVERNELKTTRNYRIYMANDALFNLGQYGNVGEVRKQSNVSSIDPVAAVQIYKSHLLSNFKGGGMF